MEEPNNPTKTRRPLEGFGLVFASARRFAFGLALLIAWATWNGLEEELGAVLPWTLHNFLTGFGFFAAFAIASLLGLLGGTLGWSVGKRLGKPELGASAGVVGFWGGLALALVLLLLAGVLGPPSPLLIPLVIVLPLLGPWVATRWLAEPVVRAWSTARFRLLGMSRHLGEQLILKRPFRLDARGLALGLLAGLLIGAAASAGLFGYPEAAILAQRIRLRNEPINTPSGPIEFGRLLSLQAQGTPVIPRDRGIVVLQIDDWTQSKLMTTTSEPAVNALLLRKLAAWHSGPVILPLSPTALTVRAVPPMRRIIRFRPGPRLRRSAPSRPDASDETPPEVLNPAAPPLDRAALERAMRDVPALVRTLRASDRALLCLLPPPAVRGRTNLGPLLGATLGPLPPTTPIPHPEPWQWFFPMLESGRPIGSAEFASYYVRQVQSLPLVDPRGRWALPLLLAAGGDRNAVSPLPSPTLAGTLKVAGRPLRLAAPGEFLVNVYGSTPDAIFPHVSYSAALNGERLYDRRGGRWVSPADFFRDRIVFLDTLNQPSYDTPAGSLRATELLATATDNIMTMNALEPPTAGMELLLLTLFGALAGHLSIGRSPFSGAARMAVLIVFYGLASALLFVYPGVWLPVVSVIAAIGFAYLLVIQFVFSVDEMELERQRGERAQLEREVAISRAIQTSLLPAGHLRSHNFEIVSRSDPAREVGGDFYNIFPLAPSAPVQSSEFKAQGSPAPNLEPSTLNLEREQSEPVAIVLGDVSGKGVQGAMYMTVATTLIEARAEPDVAPEEVLAVANAHLYPKIHRLRMFVTVFYGILDVMTGQLEFASAGQVPPVLANGGGPPAYQPTRGTPLGALRRTRYERHSVHLAPGDTLVLASDGFIEARNSRGEVLGYRGFLEIVARHSDAEPQRCLDAIFRDVLRFTGGAEDQDDRTLVVIRHHTGPEERSQ